MKTIYISNVDLDGEFLPGVVHKILGQREAFKKSGIDVDLLYPNGKNEIVIYQSSGNKLFFRGGRKIDIGASKAKKLIQHCRLAFYGSINFSDCFSTIREKKYDAIYLRFFLPGSDLVKFIKLVKESNPNVIIFLEYPTLAVRELFKKDPVRLIAYTINQKKIKKLNHYSDYIVTLTKDKELFRKPTIHMPNGIDLRSIEPISQPNFINEFQILGIASDVIISHGFDKVIKGISEYVKKNNSVNVKFRLISNPYNTILDELKRLTKELAIEENVSFELPMQRKDLTKIYSEVHFCVGSLAPHRIGLMDNYSLKHREYAAFGLPFVMSKGDDHFEDSPFVMTVERDENPLDIQAVLDFYTSLRSHYPDYPQAFRKSIENTITWEAQMKDVFAAINRGKEKQVV